MDLVRNPFSPGAGTVPPELAGRQDILQHALITLARVKCGRAEKSMLLVGLRGTGKTVLLDFGSPFFQKSKKTFIFNLLCDFFISCML